MELTNDQLGYIKSLGVLKTPIEHIPLLLELDYEKGEELIKRFKDPKSIEYRTYYSGVEKGRVATKKKLYDKGQKGDIFAIVELSKIQSEEAKDEELKRIYS